MATRLAVLLTLAVIGAPGREPPEALPPAVDACLQHPSVRGDVTVSMTVNPFYLRGDFDGDGKVDYAVAVKGAKTGKMRVLICTGAKRVYLLGSEGKEAPFSDMTGDNFFAPTWMVYTRADINDLAKFTSNVPQPVPTPKGEAIAMVWEDGISLIYWDGSRFRWAGSKE